MAVNGELNIKEEELLPHSDYIRGSFSCIEKEFDAYRWVGNPTSDEHFVSVSKMESSNGALPVALQQPLETPDIVSGLSLSMFNSKEQAKTKFNSLVSTKSKKDAKNGTNLTKAFKEKCGTFVAKVTLKPEDGYVGLENPKSGHFEFIPSRDFDWKQCIDTDDIESMI